jgi:hypothetical protein
MELQLRQLPRAESGRYPRQGAKSMLDRRERRWLAQQLAMDVA